MSLLDKSTQSFLRAADVAFLILLTVYLVGIAGLNYTASRAFFETLTSANLLLSFLLVMIFHQRFKLNLLWFGSIAFIAGMAAEIIGVATGYPFGLYHYTHSLGCQIFGVPVMIGVNWVLLNYITGLVATRFVTTTWQRVLLAALLMVTVDLLLEGFAIRHHLWVWQQALPPVQNYLAWLIISMLIQVFYQRLIPESLNPNALRYLALLLLFLLVDMVVNGAY